MKTNIIDQFEILETIPYGFNKNQKTRDKVLEEYRYELCHMVYLAQQAELQGHTVSIFLGKFDNEAFFEVRAEDLPVDEKAYNWHLQNTSQWLYAGCIKVSKDGSVSTHH